MIDYLITRADLELLVDSASSTWRGRAAARTSEFSKVGKYSEKSSIWGEIKHVYMTLQGESKCAFCERKLESVEYGLIEQGVEHFRPKRKLETWSVPAELLLLGIPPSQPPEINEGYHLLAYDLLNYCAACAPCNSILKASYFPIDAPRHEFGGTDITALDMTEKPLLIFPLGLNATKAEELIGFNGISPYARESSANYNGRRAFVTIEMFRLDDTARKNLILERCRIIIALLSQLNLLRDSRQRKRARQLIELYTSSKSPHTNCANSFVALYGSDRQAAERYGDAAFRYLNSSS